MNCPLLCLIGRAVAGITLLMLHSCSGDGPEGAAAGKMIGGDQQFLLKDFSASLAAVWPAQEAGDSMAADRSPSRPLAGNLRDVYRTAGYNPVWVAEGGVTEAAALLLNDPDSLQWDGMDPARYGRAALAAALDRLKAGGDLHAALAFDTSCSRAYLQASRDLLMGLIPARKADSLWFNSNDSSWTAPQALASLAGGGDYVPLSRYRSRQPTYEVLRAEYVRYHKLAVDTSLHALKAGNAGKKLPDSVALAIIRKECPWIRTVPGDTLSETRQLVRGFQEQYGLTPTGKLDSQTVRRLRMSPDAVARLIAANMERLRWLPQTPDARYVLVNVPLMELFFRKDGYTAFHMKVVVGKPSRQTPSLNADMANIVFSPSWGVPPVILKKDVLPGITKKGASYLTRKGLQPYDRRGRKVSPSAVTAKNFRSFNFRQPPGARNALGEVKFNLPNKWDIYLHDTPTKGDFGKRYRAKSSGCIRVERAHEFAAFILRDIEGKDQFDQFRIDSLIALRKTRYEGLARRIPVHIVYLTAFEDETGSHVRLLPDIYGRDGKLLAALTGTGAATHRDF